MLELTRAFFIERLHSVKKPRAVHDDEPKPAEMNAFRCLVWLIHKQCAGQRMAMVNGVSMSFGEAFTLLFGVRVRDTRGPVFVSDLDEDACRWRDQAKRELKMGGA